MVKNYPKGDNNDLLCNYKFFAQCYFALHYLEKTNFPTTCPSVIQRTIFWHFSELQSLFTKISIEQAEVQHEAWNLCEQIYISVNYPWRHSTFNSLPIIISLFFIFTMILIEANLKFQQMFKLKFKQILKIKELLVHKCLQLFFKKTS